MRFNVIFVAILHLKIDIIGNCAQFVKPTFLRKVKGTWQSQSPALLSQEHRQAPLIEFWLLARCKKNVEGNNETSIFSCIARFASFYTAHCLARYIERSGLTFRSVSDAYFPHGAVLPDYLYLFRNQFIQPSVYSLPPRHWLETFSYKLMLCCVSMETKRRRGLRFWNKYCGVFASLGELLVSCWCHFWRHMGLAYRTTVSNCFSNWELERSKESSEKWKAWNTYND